MTTLDELLAVRPVNERRVRRHVKRMKAEVRAYRLAELRGLQDLTQVEVAQRLHVSQKRVSEIERGDVAMTKVDTLQRYAAALGGSLKIELCVGDEVFPLFEPEAS